MHGSNIKSNQDSFIEISELGTQGKNSPNIPLRNMPIGSKSPNVMRNIAEMLNQNQMKDVSESNYRSSKALS